MVSGNRKLTTYLLGGSYLLGLPMVLVAFSYLLRYEGEGGTLVLHGLRDFTLCFLLWAFGGVGLVVHMRRNIDRASKRLSNIMGRVAEGDWSAPLPVLSDPVLNEVVSSLGGALSLFEMRDAARRERLGDARGLIRRLLELGSSPVLVVGIHAGGRLTLDYANELTSDAFGESLESREGAILDDVPGGDALRSLVDLLLDAGSAHFQTTLNESHALLTDVVADCAVVRNPVGMPTRLVVVLKEGTGKAWWRRIWEGAKGLNQNKIES